MSLANKLFDTGHLLENEASMNYQGMHVIGSIEHHEIELKNNQKIMCRNMVRKDFEMIRIHDSFLKMFNDVEFFSHHNDDLLSVEHVAQIVFEGNEFQIEMNLYEFVRDFGCQFAFNYKHGDKPELENIKDNAAALVNLLFQASTFDCEKQATKYFLKEIIKNYPHFNLKHAKEYLNDLNIELEKEH